MQMDFKRFDMDKFARLMSARMAEVEGRNGWFTDMAERSFSEDIWAGMEYTRSRWYSSKYFSKKGKKKVFVIRKAKG
jgi:hypothetical protein